MLKAVLSSGALALGALLGGCGTTAALGHLGAMRGHLSATRIHARTTADPVAGDPVLARPDGNVLVAGYNTPGRIDILTARGRIVWTYYRAAGPGALRQPSLAVMLPNGMIAATDDRNDRVVVIDPSTKRIVWQYGQDGVPGSGPRYLRKPDGLDLIP